jgi:hypothetical protein
MDALILIGAEGEAFLAWHNIQMPPKDSNRLRLWVRGWQEETGIELPSEGRS